MSLLDDEAAAWERFLDAKATGDELAEEVAHDAWAGLWWLLRVDVRGAW